VSEARPADATTTLIERLLPPATWPYARLARLDRPVGWQLLLIPCLWSEALASAASGVSPSLWRLALYVIGAIAMRAAGSAWNDLMDRDIDRRVERTRARPLAAGTIAPREALAFIVAMGLVGLAVLLQFGGFAILVGIGSLALIALYPLAKRVMSHPQIVLGLVFSWGALMSFAHLEGALGAAAILLYLASVAWIIGYDTIYAMQDIEDDKLVGIGSSALAWGPHADRLVISCYALTLGLFAASLATLSMRTGLALAPGLLVLAAGLVWQLARLRISGAPAPAPLALMLFRSNAKFGFASAALMLIAAALLARF
jgi:4-hydroxybenzoate polyprenyltransferase